jgi:hypothetical protein
MLDAQVAAEVLVKEKGLAEAIAWTEAQVEGSVFWCQVLGSLCDRADRHIHLDMGGVDEGRGMPRVGS